MNWITKDNKKISLRDMDNNHLINSFNMKMRLLSQLCDEESDYYQDFADGLSEFDDYIPNIRSPQHEEIQSTISILRSLAVEINQRKINIQITSDSLLELLQLAINAKVSLTLKEK